MRFINLMRKAKIRRITKPGATGSEKQSANPIARLGQRQISDHLSRTKRKKSKSGYVIHRLQAAIHYQGTLLLRRLWPNLFASGMLYVLEPE